MILLLDPGFAKMSIKVLNESLGYCEDGKIETTLRI
jgi:hypothetical protein